MKSLFQRLALLLAVTVLAIGSVMPAQAATGSFSIAGTVTTTGSQGVSGVSVTVLGSSITATTATDGTYTLTGLNSGLHAIVPVLTGYSFSPRGQIVNIKDANVTGVNFTGNAVTTPTTYSISGAISAAAGVSVSGITVALLEAPPASTSTGSSSSSSAAGPACAAPPLPPAIKATTTDTNGNFTFENVKPGSYEVAPKNQGLVFTPTELAATVTNADVTGIDFTAAVPVVTTYSISGAITGATGVTVSGITVSLFGGPPVATPQSTPESKASSSSTGSSPVGPLPPTLASVTTTTDANGNFSFTNVKPGRYAVYPQETGLIFSPLALPAFVTNANVTGIDFTAAATYGISGTISAPSGVSVTGISVALTGTPAKAGGPVPVLIVTETSSTGTYSFPNVKPGSYTVVPRGKGLTFTPASLPATVTSASVTGINFTAAVPVVTTYSITGTISGGSGVSGITVTLSGGPSTGEVSSSANSSPASVTATTDANGNYTFTNVKPGRYAAVPQKSGLTFSPLGLAVQVTDANVTGVNFTATAIHSISGSISGASGVSVKGILVALTGASAKTGGPVPVLMVTETSSTGTFSFQNVKAGSYTVVPRAKGLTFTPASLPAAVTNASVTGIDFAAAAASTSTTTSSTSTTSTTSSTKASVKTR